MHIALKIPVVGSLIQRVSVAKFTRTLGTLLTSGVPILEGLLIVAQDRGQQGRGRGDPHDPAERERR